MPTTLCMVEAWMVILYVYGAKQPNNGRKQKEVRRASQTWSESEATPLRHDTQEQHVAGVGILALIRPNDRSDRS